MPTPARPAAPIPTNLPNPVIRAEDSVPGSSDHRNLYCAHYGNCLVFAARKSWKDWSCEKCSLNLTVKAPGASQWAHARIRLD